MVALGECTSGILITQSIDDWISSSFTKQIIDTRRRTFEEGSGLRNLVETFG